MAGVASLEINLDDSCLTRSPMLFEASYSSPVEVRRAHYRPATAKFAPFE